MTVLDIMRPIPIRLHPPRTWWVGWATLLTVTVVTLGVLVSSLLQR